MNSRAILSCDGNELLEVGPKEASVLRLREVVSVRIDEIEF